MVEILNNFVYHLLHQNIKKKKFKKSDYNLKITGTEHNIKKLQAYDLSYYRGKQY